MSPLRQGCQMAYFQTKNPSLGNFWRALQWKMFVSFTAIWSILQPFGIFYGYLVYFSLLVCCTTKNLATLLSAKNKKWFPS
jgi:hypothetical protein